MIKSLIVVVLLLLTGQLTRAEDAAAVPAADKPTKEAAPAVSEWDQIIAVCQLEGDQLAAFQKKVAARDAAMQAWQKSEKGQKLTALREQQAEAKKANDEAKQKELAEQMAGLSKEEWGLRHTVRAEVLGALTLAQQQKWAAHQLYPRVARELRRAKLTEEQIVKAKEICAQQAAGFVKEGTVAADPYLTTLKEIQPAAVKAITETLLTLEQKAALQPAPKPAEKAAE